MITALVVDDELYAREELAVLLRAEPEIEIVGLCGNAIETLKLVNSLRPDALFLDIHMPQISGLELAGMIDPDRRPRIVFVTAHDAHAIEAFEKSALDYLLKPVDPARLAVTIDRLRCEAPHEPPPNPLVSPHLTQIPCVAGQRIRLIPADAVIYAYSDASGVHVVTGDGVSFTELTLRVLEAKTDLVRCHRQYLVNLARAREIRLLDNGSAQVWAEGETVVPVSRRHLREIKNRVGLV